MGRGGRGSTTTATTAVSRTTRGRPSPLAMQASAVATALWGYSTDPAADLNAINEAVSGSAAGRGGRFIAAVNDLMSVEELALEPGSAALAQTTFDNALWHATRLAHVADPQGTIALRLNDVLRQRMAPGAAGVVERLHRDGMLSDEQRDRLQPQAGDLLMQAYTSNAAAAPWAAVRVLERARRVRQDLQEAAQDPELAGVAERALKDVDQQVGKAQRMLEGNSKLGYQVSKDAPAVLTRVEAISAALGDDRARQVNRALGGSFRDAHRALVGELGRVRDIQMASVSDERWLAQIMNYQAQIAGVADQVEAVHTDSMIMLAPHVADDCADAAAEGRASDILIHEHVHATQPTQAAGRVLGEDHHALELALMEGATQSLTNELSASLASDPRHGLSAGTPSHAYGPWTALVDEAAEMSGDPGGFRRALSAAPSNSRTARIAETFLGDASPASQRVIVDALGPVAAHEGDEESVRARVRAALSGLRVAA